MTAGVEIVRQTDEAELLAGFRHGNPPAFEALFRRHQGEVYGWIVRIVRDSGIAEDLTIETFWRIHAARERFDPARGFAPWARRIATRVALDWLRKKRPENIMPDEFFAAVPSQALPDPVITAENRREIALAFGRLPPKLRIAATLVVVEERPHREVAAALGITAVAVKLRVFRALRKLRTDLERRGIRP